MADTPIWDGTANFQPGNTPFGFYDGDQAFQNDANLVAKFCASRLGWPMQEVELQSESFFTCFEEAVTTYGNEVFQYKIRENYISLEGGDGVTLLNGRVINPSMQRIIGISQNYGTEAGVGGNVTKYKGELDLTGDVQEYDLDAWATAEGITGGIEVRKVFYESPPAILRYFDPYAGTGTGIQSLMDAFDFGSYSPGVNFLLMPIYFDMLKVQAIEFNDQVRKSAYSFEIVDNKLRLFPVPKQPGKLFFDYYKLEDKQGSISSDGTDLITNVGEVPYQNPTYASINSVGRQWIYRYTLALSKELLGYIRGKYSQLPIPGSEVTLNQADLLADARSEKEALLTQLRDMLEQTSRQSQLEKRATEASSLRTTLGDAPMTIYVG